MKKVIKKIYLKLKAALLKRRRRFEKRLPFLKQYHPITVFIFILSLILTMRLIIFPFLAGQMVSFRSYVELHYGEIPKYSIEAGMIITLIFSIMIIVRSIKKYKKSKPIKGERMKAIIYETYGEPEVLKLSELKKPKNGRDEILIKIIATTVTTADINMRGFTYVPKSMKFFFRLILGISRPKKELIGNVFSGVIEDVGVGVKGFNIGDEVFGIDSKGTGAYAQYKCISDDKAVLKKTDKLNFLEAAALPFGAMTAWHFCKKSKIHKHQEVLIIGASGSVGLYAIQIARSMGANITAVCSTSHIDMIKKMDILEVIDYTKTNFHNNAKLYDVIINTTIENANFNYHKNSLKANGKYLAIAGGFGDQFRSIFNIFNTQKVIAGVTLETKELLQTVLSMVELGEIEPIIDEKVFILEELSKAHMYAQSNNKQGNVVIIVDEKYSKEAYL